MHGCSKRIGFADDDRRGQDLVAADPGEFPKSGEGEGIKILSLKAVGLLSICPFLPFEEARGRDESSALRKGFAKESFLMHRLRAGVDVGNLWDRLRPPGREP